MVVSNEKSVVRYVSSRCHKGERIQYFFQRLLDISSQSEPMVFHPTANNHIGISGEYRQITNIVFTNALWKTLVKHLIFSPVIFTMNTKRRFASIHLPLLFPHISEHVTKFLYSLMLVFTQKPTLSWFITSWLLYQF